MNTALPVLIFVGGVAAILILEIKFTNHRVTEAIRPWQSGLGALLGFVSLALSVQMNAAATQHSQRLERDAAGRHLALSLHAEILPLLARLTNINSTAAQGSAMTKNMITSFSAKELKDTKIKVRCSGGKKEIRAVKPIGVFEANKANLGLLPGQLAYFFVDLHHSWAELNESIEALPEQSECTAELQRSIEFVEVAARIVILRMRLIDDEYQRLGIPAAWTIRETK
jgi:hypothetical protein